MNCVFVAEFEVQLRIVKEGSGDFAGLVGALVLGWVGLA